METEEKKWAKKKGREPLVPEKLQVPGFEPGVF
jgi:hypothetical protein